MIKIQKLPDGYVLQSEWIRASREIENSREWHESREELTSLIPKIIPEVGLRGSVILYSDVYPFRVERVISRDVVEIVRLDYGRNRSGDMEILDTPRGEPFRVSRRKNGYWYRVGAPMRSGEPFYTMTYCACYIDPSF